jgi:hypothetical protein
MSVSNGPSAFDMLSAGRRGKRSFALIQFIPRPACHEHVEWEATDHLLTNASRSTPPFNGRLTRLRGGQRFPALSSVEGAVAVAIGFLFLKEQR